MDREDVLEMFEAADDTIRARIMLLVAEAIRGREASRVSETPAREPRHQTAGRA